MTKTCPGSTCMPLTAVATFIAVAGASASASMLPCVGSRCWMTTKAMPLSAGMAESSSTKAASPPADAPMPTTGKPARGCLDLLEVITPPCIPKISQGLLRHKALRGHALSTSTDAGFPVVRTSLRRQEAGPEVLDALCLGGVDVYGLVQ